MTPERSDAEPAAGKPAAPRRLNYQPVPPVYAPPLTPGQRVILALFILFPVALVVWYVLAVLTKS